tara:strand:- start:392 stop:586 length:195 start_codon:yes stop_codon:yes gene_type:complete
MEEVKMYSAIVSVTSQHCNVYKQDINYVFDAFDDNDAIAYLKDNMDDDYGVNIINSDIVELEVI